MMGVSNRRPASPDGKIIEPLEAHGVKFMSMGLMLREDEAVIWRGPDADGRLAATAGAGAWGELDVLIVDLPPGTGDVQLTLCQRTQLTGAIVVSTPQDVALLDARKALDMFVKLKTPVLGLIENMSTLSARTAAMKRISSAMAAWRPRRAAGPALPGRAAAGAGGAAGGRCGHAGCAGDGPLAEAPMRGWPIG
jgi:ATP-binding protein involved in chromosome partitioning